MQGLKPPNSKAGKNHYGRWRVSMVAPVFERMAHIEPGHIALYALLAVMVSPFVWVVM